jgi:serine/threonine protein phosphatase PrpC
MRVWAPNDDMPGLAMSRSMGDGLAHSVGVTPIPEITQYDVQPEDRFLIIASDGIWEFMTNEEVANVVAPYFDQNLPEAGANQLVKEALKTWQREEDVVDDITCVIVFLK